MIDKQHIIAKATDLFKQNGLKNTTMDDIANEMGISKKTIYQHICDRNELIEVVIGNEYIVLEKKIRSISKDSFDSIDELIGINIMILTFLKGINPVGVNDLRKHYPEIFNLSKERYSTLFVGILRNNLNRGIQNKLYQDDINIDVIVGIHSDRIEKMQQANNLFEAKQSAPEIMKQMITYYIRGLVTKKGQETLDKHIVKFDKYLE